MKRSGWANDAFFGLIVTFAMSFAVAAANAGELFVMPYSCSVIGGRPVLTPSDDHGYTVIGRREQREFSACSPADPGLCKQWKLYRFDLDCGGTRMPWVSIAAAAGADRNGRAWVENGRLHIEMPSRWSMDPDDPCAQPYSDENWWRPGGFASVCAERRAQARDQVIELPGGYAPMMGLDGIFVAEAAPKADPNSSPSAAQNSPPIKTARPAPPKKTPVDVQNSATRQVTQPSALRPPKKDIAPPPPSSTALEAHLEVAPKIINQGNTSQNTANTSATISKTDPAPPPAAISPSAPSKAAPPSDDSSAPQTASMPASTVLAPPSTTRPPPQAPIITGSVPETSVLAHADSMDKGVLAAVSLAALGLVVLSFFQWRERAQPRLAGNRDLASVSFDSRATGRDIAIAPANSALWVPSLDKQYPIPEADTGRQLDLSSEIPQTREQAIQILGMGVTPDVSAAAIKKIVDGLRLSWHPDHAKSIEERQLRELRMKQINAAWDIISGKHFA